MKSGAQPLPSIPMLDYYARRAPEYEAIYRKPERQSELQILRDWVTQQVRGRRVLELACGTGYWTAVAAPVAQSIDAYDLNQATLEIARAKNLGAHVRLAIGDAYAPAAGDYDCVLAGFWWSHVPIARIADFVRTLAASVHPGGTVLLMDNCFAAGSSTPIARTDAEGNMYQRRRLSDGSNHEVLKNFPDRAALYNAFAPAASSVDIDFLRYYWRLTATLKNP